MAFNEDFRNLLWQYCDNESFSRVKSFSGQGISKASWSGFLDTQEDSLRRSGFWTSEMSAKYNFYKKHLRSFDEDDADSLLESFISVLSLCSGEDFFRNLYKLYRTKEQAEILDRFSIENFKFYQWLAAKMKENLPQDLGMTFLLKEGSGLFAYSLLDACYFNFSRLRNFDEDQYLEEFSELLLHSLVVSGWFYKAGTFNPSEKSYGMTEWTARVSGGELNFSKTEDMYEEAQTIVNLQCDNMDDYHKWYDSVHAGKLLVLVSSNNPDSTLPLSNLDEFNGRSPKSRPIYQDEYFFGDYSKYLLIFEK